MADRTLYDDYDEQATRWGRRTIVGAALSAVALLAFTGHEPTDNGRRATPVAVITAQVCWVEPTDQLPEGVELLRGTETQRPARSIEVRCP